MINDGTICYRGELPEVALSQADRRSAWQHALSCLNLFLSLHKRLGISMAIELVARLVLAQDPALATRLLSFVDILREPTGVIADPIEHAMYTSAKAQARERLALDIFSQCWENGQVMTLEQAIAEIVSLPSTCAGA